MTNEGRAQALMLVAQYVHARRLDHPVRVAVDGVTASGKTTLADELSNELTKLGRSVHRLSMDGFHHPRARRYKQGRHSALGYYEDAYDFSSLAQHVLIPLGPGGDFHYRRAIIDLATDTPVDEPALQLQQSAVLVVDGTFLQKSEIVDLWDTTIFVHTSFDVARRRGVARDAAALGGITQADHAFKVRYHAASQLYLDEASPAERASLVFDNDDLDQPSVRMVHPESP
ncbi:hypothetical protein [Rhodococcus sovatensis]|uniref:Phosphoribulokinase/uridine kinase domain-containing protein n=1 Tax=Rhodococcus sovatensis TaxID=1805840 RepID=A0ABZ2PJ04_9NOCA